MEITADQLTALMAVITHATTTIGWVIGIAVTIFLACFGGAMGIVFRQHSEKILGIEQKADEARQEADKLKDEVNNFSARCAATRAGCREQFLTRYVTDAEMKEMEKEFKDLVQDMLRRLEAQLHENRITLLHALKDAKTEISNSVVNHQHDDKGVVLVRRVGG